MELALLSEQKTAKVIELLEEVRRDNPRIRDRIDQQADAMAQPSDLQQVPTRSRRSTPRRHRSATPARCRQ
jgi:uncharacterized membrane protein